MAKARQNNKILSIFHEGPLNFDPTYKYDFNCNIYDTSQKNRIPGWCDRILMSRNHDVKKHLIHDPYGSDEMASKPIYYNRRENFFSDHRPVLAVYRVQAIRIDEESREKLLKELLKKLMDHEKVSNRLIVENTEKLQQEDFTKIM